MRKKIFSKLKRILVWMSYPIIGFALVSCAVLSRFKEKKIDVGLGPEPLINNIYHKKALLKAGYTAETFVTHVYFITQKFDLRFDHLSLLTASIYVMFIVLFRYKCVYIYFNGGPLSFTPLKHLEPYLYKIARIKVLVMPYGGDVNDMTHCPNYLFRHALVTDYPLFQKHRRVHIAKQIDRWIKHADIVISGCDWVHYTYHWDILTLAHFSIDTESTVLEEKDFCSANHGSLKILHAPNHKTIKGTDYFQRAVEDLRAEGLDIELIIIQNEPNETVRRLIDEVDIIADQLVVGWYAMFALEGMAAGKPVLCYLDPKLIELYTFAGLIKKDEIPIVQCRFDTVKEKIRDLYDHRERIPEIGLESRKYVEKHHSLTKIGSYFRDANTRMGIQTR